jgi:hypothetical protein
MGLADLVDQTMQTIKGTVRLNNVRMRGVLSIDLAYSLNESITSATIQLVSNPGVEPEATVHIYQGYDVYEQLVFTGLVDTVERNDVDGTFTVTCRDLLKKAMDTFLVQEIKFGMDVPKQLWYYSTYSGGNGGIFEIHEYTSLSALTTAHPETAANYSQEGVKAEAVVQWMLAMCGLQAGTQIRVDDTDFWIGDKMPATFHLCTVYDAIQQICELMGWYVFCDVGGVVRFKKRPRRASGYTAWTYSTQLHNIRTLTESFTNTDLRNFIEVHGASGIKVVARADSEYLGSTPYRGVVIGNDLIDTSGIATFIANRVLRDLNRLKHTATLEVNGNPFLFPGQSIKVNTASTQGIYMIESMSPTMSSDGGYTTMLTTASFPDSNDDDDDDEDDVDIEAMFVFTNSMIIGDPKVLVQVDGSSSYSSRGRIVLWTWEFPGSYTPVVESEASSVWVAYDQTVLEAGATIRLTVEDMFGNMDTYEQVVTMADILGDSEPMYRQLYAALTTHAAGTQDGGETWNILPCPAVSVAASMYSATSSNPVSYALFGGSDGVVYRTTNYCASLVPVATLGGQITALCIPELDASRALAGTSDGNVYLSTDSGLSWTLLKTFAGMIRQVEFGYKNHQYMTVVVSDPSPPGAYVSGNGGAGWAKLTDFGAKDMQWYTAGAQTPYWLHSEGIVASIPQPDPLSFEDSSDHFMVAGTVMLDRDDGVMAAERGGQLWTAASGILYPTQDMEGNTIRHMIRDADVPLVVYYASRNGVEKSLDRNTTTMSLLDMSDTVGGSAPTSPFYRHESTGWGEMVALGPSAPIVPPPLGRLVVQIHNPLPGYTHREVTLSGYTATGLPIYHDWGVNGAPDGTGLFLVVGSGSGQPTLCAIQRASKTGRYRVLQAGPGQLLCGAWYSTSEREGLPFPPYTSNEEAVFSPINEPFPNMLTVLDLTSVTVSGFRLDPTFRVVGWSPRGETPYGKIGIDQAYITYKRDADVDPRYTVTYHDRTQYGNFLNAYTETFLVPSGVMRSEEVLRSDYELSPNLFTAFGFHGHINFRMQGVTRTSPSATTFSQLVHQHQGGWKQTYKGLLRWTEDGGFTTEALGVNVRDYHALGPKIGTHTAAYYYDSHITARWFFLSKIVAGELYLSPIYAPEGGVLHIGESAKVKSDLYIVSPTKVYRAGGYGAGTLELLWELPSYYKAAWGDARIGQFSVSHNRGYTKDYLVLTVQRSPSAFDVWLSLDNGATWEFAGGPYRTFSSGYAIGAWWVDS